NSARSSAHASRSTSVRSRARGSSVSTSPTTPRTRRSDASSASVRGRAAGALPSRPRAAASSSAAPAPPPPPPPPPPPTAPPPSFAARHDMHHFGKAVEVALGRGTWRLQHLSDHREREIFLLPQPADEPQPLEVFRVVVRDGAPALARSGQETFPQVEVNRL